MMMSINAPNVASSVVTNGIPKSLIEAICFLTRPLFMLYSHTEVLALQNVLQTTLMTTYLASRDSTLLLTLSPTSPPPRSLLAACIAANVQWMDWIMLLGNQQIDLLIEPCRVVVRFGGEMGKVTTIWQELKYEGSGPRLSRWLPSTPPRFQAPSNSGARHGPTTNHHERPTHAFLRATVDSARARASGRTKAQELLEVTDKEETEEIFALLSNLTVTGITPTPARDCFSLGQWEKGMPVPISASSSANGSILSPISSPGSSRPSSRSSNLSGFSLASSSIESMTTAASMSPFSPTESKQFVIPPISCNGQPTSPQRSRVYVPPHPVRARAQVPSDPEPIEIREDEESPIYIDTSKQSMQKYLYQGGVSTVLTGGVMLGPQKRTQQIPPRMRKYQAFSSIANASGNWRRF